jgi:formate dehydrogenase iron-sulfur subunit
MCYDRVIAGGQPACVEACPEKATIYGQRDLLIKQAHRRIQDNPGRYIDKVFGETEIGGTAVIYISDIPLDFLAFKPKLGDEPLPKLTWAALSKVPPLVVGVGAVMTGVWWVVGRRMKLAQEAAQSTAPAEQIDQGSSDPGQSSEGNEA